jgi:hypothetical protein
MAVTGDALLEFTGAYRINYAIMGNLGPARMPAFLLLDFLSQAYIYASLECQKTQ